MIKKYLYLHKTPYHENSFCAFLFVTAFICQSCGTQKKAVEASHTGPMVPTRFYGVSLGDPQSWVSGSLSMQNSIKQSDGTHTLLNKDFAMNNWHYVHFSFYDEILFVVSFEQDFTTEEEANEMFKMIYPLLILKYGNIGVADDRTYVSYIDEVTNMVSLSVESEKTIGGRTVWYCELTYFWGAGVAETYLKSVSEI